MKEYSDYKIDLMGKTGEQVRVLCPECSPTRKKSKIKDLAVNTTLQTWYCHHCSWKGGLNGNGKVYTIPEYTSKPILPPKIIEWFKNRGISEQTLKSNKISSGPIWMPGPDKEVHSIQFPYFKNGTVVNIKYRDADKNMRQAKNAEKCFYGFDLMTNESDTLIICEGEPDKLSLFEVGYKSDIVSVPDGAPTPNTNTYNTKFDFLKPSKSKLEKYNKIILAVDNDEPGHALKNALAKILGEERCLVPTYPKGCKDINDVLKNHGRSAVVKVIDNATWYPIPGIISPNDNIEYLENEYENGAVVGLKTGWFSLDKYYTVAPGELTVVTGIPNHGKSNWLDCLMLNLIQLHNWKFAVWSPENHPVPKHQRTLSEKLTKSPFRKKWNDNFPRMRKTEIRSVSQQINNNLTFIEPPEEKEPTIDLILDYARMVNKRSKIDALIIDPYNELVRDFTYTTETQYISDMLGKLRRFGRTHNVHIFIVAHPQKLQKQGDGSYHAPTMYDIAGSANWRNKADNGICVNRIFKEHEKDHVEIIIQKIRYRDNGCLGECRLRYEYATALYRDDIDQDSY